MLRHASIERRTVGSIDSRLQRLEGQGHRCPECGLAPHERRPPALINEEHPDKSFDGDPYERCPECGRPLYTVLNVVYEGEEGGGGLLDQYVYGHQAQWGALHAARTGTARPLLGPPANAEKRRRGASRGGRATANRELPELKSLLSDLTDRVLVGELETGRAAVANQLVNTRLRAVEVERKIRQDEEIEERIAALERLAGRQDGGKRWPA
jgi:hypothetical protein